MNDTHTSEMHTSEMHTSEMRINDTRIPTGNASLEDVRGPNAPLP